MDEDVDENDSPFAHVPITEAGPTPLQDGAFTYDKIIASAGYGTIRSASRRWIVVMWIVGLLVLAAVLLPLVLAIAR